MSKFYSSFLTFFFVREFIFRVFSWILLFAAAPCLLAQTVPSTPSTRELEQVLEFLAQANVSVPSLDLLEYYHRYPLPLKTASVRDLQTLPAISVKTALAIKKFLKRNPNADFTALQDSLELSLAQIYVLRFCTTVALLEQSPPREKTSASGRESPSNLALWYRTRTRFWATPQRGFTPQATASQQFQGSPLELYQRLTASLRVDSIGFFEVNMTAAKDAGELALTDFLSGYIRAEFSSEGQRTSVVAGDFLVESGKGTAFWSLYGPGKSADVIAPATQLNVNLQPYRSSTEQQFYRGVALKQERMLGERLSLTLLGWGSWQTRAARLDTVRDVITSLDFAGLFRTRSELALRGNLAEQVYGFVAEVNSQDRLPKASAEKSGTDDSKVWAWSLGAGAQYLSYDRQIVSRSVMVFPQQNGVITSIFGTMSNRQMLIAGEISRDGTGNVGGRIGAEMRLPGWELALLMRAFPTDFRSPFGVNFGENSKPTNETGIYLGAIWKQIPNLRVHAYADFYTTFSSTATIPVPVRGVDIFTETTYRFKRDAQFILRLRHETKTDEVTLGTGRNSRNIIYGRGRTSIRFHSDWDIAENLRLQARTEAAYVSYEGNAEPQWGILGFLGAAWSPGDWISLTGRMVAFRTDSFDSALWQYETAVPGTLSNPALFGQGLRAYLMLEIQPTQWLTLTARGSMTRRFDVSVLGSGATQINNNTDAQLVVQVDVRF